jgi:hypothetical protein
MCFCELFLTKGLPWVLVYYAQQPLHVEAMERSQLVQRQLIAHHLYLADYLESGKVSIEGNIKEGRRSISDKTRGL